MGFFKKKKLLEYSSSCVDFSQKKRKEKTFLSNVFLQDKLEIDEKKLGFF